MSLDPKDDAGFAVILASLDRQFRRHLRALIAMWLLVLLAVLSIYFKT